MIVLKFGGSALSSAKNIEKIGRLISDLTTPIIVVVSAMGNTTDDLIESATLAAVTGTVNIEKIERFHQKIYEALGVPKEKIEDSFSLLTKKLEELKIKSSFSSKDMDEVLSLGEYFSALIVSQYLKRILGSKNIAFCESWNLGLLAEGKHGDGKFLEESLNMIKRKVEELNADVLVTTGFIAKTKNGEIITLGRGGSDLTATVMAKAVGAKEVQFWKDVDGIMTADPRIVSAARVIKELSFKDAVELAFFGAKVMHPKALRVLKNTNIEVKIKNIYNKGSEGTTLKPFVDLDVSALAHKKKQYIVTISTADMGYEYGFLYKVFKIFTEYEEPVDFVATGEASVSISLESMPRREIVEELKKLGEVSIDSLAMVSIIGNMKNLSSVSERAFKVLSERNIDCKAISSSIRGNNLTFLVPESDVEDALVALHKEFFESDVE